MLVTPYTNGIAANRHAGRITIERPEPPLIRPVRAIAPATLRGHCCVDRNPAAFGLAGSAASEAHSQFVESSADTLPGRAGVGDLVVAATKVLHEGVTGCHDVH